MKRPRSTTLLTLPLTLLLLVLVIVPLGILALYSVYTQNAFFEPVPSLTTHNYTSVVSGPLFRTYVGNTLAIALPTAVAATACGFALAYFITFRARRWRMPLLAAVVVCYMGSFLAYIYSWRTISGEHGLVNAILQSLGIVDRPVEWILFDRFAVIVAETQFFLPFTTLVLFSSLSALSPNFVPAARDLGATPAQAFRRVILPQAGRATFGAFNFVFFLSAADYVTPVFLGGTGHTVTLGTAISDAISTELNFPEGAATGFVMMVLLVVVAGAAGLLLRAARLLPRQVR
jgi:ABC-type spermidine/putrescine transport system permease subunit I